MKRKIFILAFIANLLLILGSLILGPSKVAIHFGAAGLPNGWATAGINAGTMCAVALLIFISFFFTPQLLRKAPDRWISIPNRKYWMQPENRGEMERRFMSQLYTYGTLTIAFLFAIGLLALHANLSKPIQLRMDLFWWAFGIYMAYTAYWCVKLLLLFRVPKEE